MHSGETYMREIKLPCDASEVSEIAIVFTQANTPVIRKKMSDITLVRDKAVVVLEPDESAKLKPFYRICEVQAKGKTSEGFTFITDVESFPVEETLL